MTPSINPNPIWQKVHKQSARPLLGALFTLAAVIAGAKKTGLRVAGRGLSPHHSPGSVHCQPNLTMASTLRISARRFATSAVRAAAADTTNAYGIKVSKAQGVVDQLTGGA